MSRERSRSSPCKFACLVDFSENMDLGYDFIPWELKSFRLTSSGGYVRV